ncbi:MAG TPA: hypothetical protein VGI64_01230 [Streptosporangiaceae bacterium]|jgi:hypothetical protein
MKRYKFQALVTLRPPAADARQAQLSGAGRVVIRARDHDTGDLRMLSALVTSVEEYQPGDAHKIMTVVALGSDPAGCLSAGDEFSLWRGGTIGNGTVTRRIFV